MTDSEVYESAKRYSSLRALPGHAAQKAYWAKELRVLIAVVNHNIIMNRGSDGKGLNSQHLVEAYSKLRAGLEEANQHVRAKS